VLHPDYLVEHLNAYQLAEWEAYDKIDPIGEWREDFRFAKLTSLIQNLVFAIYCGKGETPKAVTILDEMPDWTGEKKAAQVQGQTQEQIKQTLLNIAAIKFPKINKPRKTPPPPKKQKK
jgi:hypothetical protein